MRDPKFLVTDECGRLTRWLRLCGYDTVQMTARPLAKLYRCAYNEGRVIVTRNRDVTPSCLIRVIRLESQVLEPQLSQLLRELRLTIDSASTFTRCDRCNFPVEPVDKIMVNLRVPPYVFQTQQTFHICPSCQRIYWMATHWERACRFFDRLRKEASHA